MQVEKIEAKRKFDPSNKDAEKLRVAAYCRVSTKDVEQGKSLENMIKHYTKFIKDTEEWEFAGIYADDGATGTKTNVRPNFQRLIDDCENGKIDMVITKSLSRFARNTEDLLRNVRKLREKKVAIIFDEDHINTTKLQGELLLTVLSAVAQQEVENTSENVKKGLQMKMQRGELVGFQGCLGYDYDRVTKTLSINEDEAETVRYIFERYVAGAGGTVIARELNEQGKKTIRGNPWTSASVIGIVKNEKYKGALLLGKTYTVDSISKRRLENFGEADQYYVKDHHLPIVSAETYEKAKEIRDRRGGGKKKGERLNVREKYSREYAFSCMVECGFCGAGLSRRTWHSSSKYQRVIWQCVKSTKHGKRFCPDSKGIPEDVIEAAFVESYCRLSADNKDVLEEFLNRLEKSLQAGAITKKLQSLQAKELTIMGDRKKIAEKHIHQILPDEVYVDLDRDYRKKLESIRSDIDLLENELNHEKTIQERVDELRQALSFNHEMEVFDREIFESIVDKVIVGGYNNNGEKDPYKITFIYKTGFTDGVDASKRRYDTSRYNKKLCSHDKIEDKELYSNHEVNTCGDGMFIVQTS